MTWTSERRAKQSQAIRQWKPWSKSTGAKTPEGKAIVSMNAYAGGHRPYMRQLLKDMKIEINSLNCLVNKYRIVVDECATK